MVLCPTAGLRVSHQQLSVVAMCLVSLQRSPTKLLLYSQRHVLRYNGTDSATIEALTSRIRVAKFKLVSLSSCEMYPSRPKIWARGVLGLGDVLVSAKVASIDSIERNRLQAQQAIQLAQVQTKLMTLLRLRKRC
eukprot:2376054-Amphidinium_carterae.2